MKNYRTLKKIISPFCGIVLAELKRKDCCTRKKNGDISL